MAYRNKVFVSFDGDNDIHYYRLMTAWKQNDNLNFNFFDAHDLNTARDSSMEATIKRRLRERLGSSKVFVCLIGNRTKYLYKFVRWEIETAISMQLPIISVNLNGKRFVDDNLCPPILRNALAMHVTFSAAVMQHALEHWPTQHSGLVNSLNGGPYYYKDEVYRNLGVLR